MCLLPGPLCSDLTSPPGAYSALASTTQSFSSTESLSSLLLVAWFVY